MNPLKTLWESYGQAVWLDFIDRDLVTGDGLQRLIRADGVRGVTSNPSIFKQAISKGGSYDAAIDAMLQADPGVATAAIYEELAVQDIRMAADSLRQVYDLSHGYDGYVSLEVSPHLANDAAATVDEARRLWRQVDRPNLMIKVPATAAGMPAVEELIAAGINVNVTLIFSLAHYEATARAYLAGLARAAEPKQVASVASFFVSRVDSVVDKLLAADGRAEARALCGKTAVANARVAYARFLELFHGDAFAALKERGARVQRPLWASTSTKNPAYRDVLYVEELIGSETVNTIPTDTLDAFRDHGVPRRSLDDGIAEAVAVLDEIAALGVDLQAVTEQLQVAGVQAFVDAYDELLEVIDAARRRRAN